MVDLLEFALYAAYLDRVAIDGPDDLDSAESDWDATGPGTSVRTNANHHIHHREICLMGERF